MWRSGAHRLDLTYLWSCTTYIDNASLPLTGKSSVHEERVSGCIFPAHEDPAKVGFPYRTIYLSLSILLPRISASSPSLSGVKFGEIRVLIDSQDYQDVACFFLVGGLFSIIVVEDSARQSIVHVHKSNAAFDQHVCTHHGSRQTALGLLGWKKLIMRPRNYRSSTCPRLVKTRCVFICRTSVRARPSLNLHAESFACDQRLGVTFSGSEKEIDRLFIQSAMYDTKDACT